MSNRTEEKQNWRSADSTDSKTASKSKPSQSRETSSPENEKRAGHQTKNADGDAARTRADQPKDRNLRR